MEGYKTIIIESDTGTGKTSTIAELFKKEESKIISLAEQQKKSFEKEEINMKDYRERNINMEEENIICCLNSLLKFNEIKKDIMKEKILYLDESTSLIMHMIDNSTLQHIQKLVYMKVMRLIKNCGKVIITDAIMNDNIVNLLKERNKEEMIYIKNNYKKNEGIKAINYKNENSFYNKIKQEFKEDKFFLIGCDTLKACQMIYEELNKVNPEKKILLITSENKVKLTDVNKQFSEHVVIYSPSITTGINYDIETKQNVYLHLTCQTVNPEEMYQIMNRTRSKEKIYYYIKNKT